MFDYMVEVRRLHRIITHPSQINGTPFSPQHSISDDQCRLYVFEICQLIAQKSDPGRKALIDGKALPVLLRLVADTIANNVIRACDLLKVLAQTGTYRSELRSAGVKDAMDRITRCVYDMIGCR